MEGTESLTVAPLPAAEDAGENPPATAITDAPNQGGGPAVAPPSAAAGTASMSVAVAVAVAGMKRKRGRPRKYSPDGSLAKPMNQTPASGSVPLGEYPAVKRGRGRAMGVLRHPQHQQQHSVELESFGEMISCAAGANFTPHVINVAAGEDVTTKIISLSQQGPRAICILSSNGVISNATLRQSDSSGGTLTYEGRFELLSLSGSFIPTENGGTRSCPGEISVSLASQDGRVVGGGVAGRLVAASPVQVVVGSFMPSYQLEQKIKKPKLETGSASTPEVTIPPSITEMESSTSLKSTVAITTCKGENWVSLHPISDTRSPTPDTNVSTAFPQDLGSP